LGIIGLSGTSLNYEKIKGTAARVRLTIVSFSIYPNDFSLVTIENVEILKEVTRA